MGVELETRLNRGARVFPDVHVALLAAGDELRVKGGENRNALAVRTDRHAMQRRVVVGTLSMNEEEEEGTISRRNVPVLMFHTRTNPLSSTMTISV